MNVIERGFAPLYGIACWNVRQGYGSFLCFEFGRPRPEPDGKVFGEWHLWIYCCRWTIARNDEVVADSESSSDRIKTATDDLNGKSLILVRFDPKQVRTEFEFDSGIKLITRPYDRASEQWHLYKPSGHVLTVRADRAYCDKPGNEAEHESDYRPI